MAGHNGAKGGEETRLHDLLERDNLGHLVTGGRIMLNSVISGVSYRWQNNVK
jgi:hypothetical protein